MEKLYPLKFDNIFKVLVWGGNKIAPYKGVETQERNIGESWELSAVKGDESIVAYGPLKGKNITELSIFYKGELLGKKVYARTGTEFPLLIKFIDACQDLSVQVHPDDELAAVRHNGSKGKTEMWYVVQADEHAHLMSGLSEKVTPEEYVSRIGDNTITSVLHDYNVKEGDVFFLPAGRIHSIGSGCFIAEIQQTSNITYRIYDFGRVGLDGKPRQLHTEESKAAVDYSVLPEYKTDYQCVKGEESKLVDCDYFKTSLYEIDDEVSKDMSLLDSFMIVICVGGKGVLKDNDGNEISVRQGETVLLPACTKNFTLIPDGSLKVLTCHI